MLTGEKPRAATSSDEWVPDWWGTDEQNYRDAQKFSSWARNVGKTR